MMMISYQWIKLSWSVDKKNAEKSAKINAKAYGNIILIIITATIFKNIDAAPGSYCYSNIPFNWAPFLFSMSVCLSAFFSETAEPLDLQFFFEIVLGPMVAYNWSANSELIGILQEWKAKKPREF